MRQCFDLLCVDCIDSKFEIINIMLIIFRSIRKLMFYTRLFKGIFDFMLENLVVG